MFKDYLQKKPLRHYIKPTIIPSPLEGEGKGEGYEYQ